MNRTEPVELANLCMIYNGDRFVLQNRRKADWRGYTFPGGHVEPNESFIDSVIREMKEETGIELSKNSKYTPFAILNGYYKDWPNVGVNRKTEIYYYEVQTDLLPNLSNTSYTEHEKSGDFELRYVKVDDLLMEINHNAFVYGDEKGIAKEMLELLKIYFNNKK